LTIGTIGRIVSAGGWRWWWRVIGNVARDSCVCSSSYRISIRLANTHSPRAALSMSVTVGTIVVTWRKRSGGRSWCWSGCGGRCWGRCWWNISLRNRSGCWGGCWGRCGSRSGSRENRAASGIVETNSKSGVACAGSVTDVTFSVTTALLGARLNNTFAITSDGISERIDVGSIGNETSVLRKSSLGNLTKSVRIGAVKRAGLDTEPGVRSIVRSRILVTVCASNVGESRRTLGSKNNASFSDITTSGCHVTVMSHKLESVRVGRIQIERIQKPNGFCSVLIVSDGGTVVRTAVVCVGLTGQAVRQHLSKSVPNWNRIRSRTQKQSSLRRCRASLVIGWANNLSGITGWISINRQRRSVNSIN
jgi:hypothetical protein